MASLGISIILFVSLQQVDLRFMLLGLLTRYPEELNVSWTTVSRHQSTNYSGTFWKVPGHYVWSLYKRNHTFKIYEHLTSSIDASSMSQKKVLNLKLDLLQEFSYPSPFPKNMFLKLAKGSSNQQSYVILGGKGTGKYISYLRYLMNINNS